MRSRRETIVLSAMDFRLSPAQNAVDESDDSQDINEGESRGTAGSNIGVK